MIVRSGDGVTVVFNDAMFNMPHASGFAGFIFKYVTQSTGGPRVSRLARMFIVKDRLAFRGHMLKLAELPELRRVIVSHHRMITEDAAGAIRTAVATLG